MKILKNLRRVFPLYTHKRVVQITKDTINATIHGTFEFIKNDTDIVHVDTREVIDNAEIDLKKGKNISSLRDQVYQQLEKEGIHAKRQQK